MRRWFSKKAESDSQSAGVSCPFACGPARSLLAMALTIVVILLAVIGGWRWLISQPGPLTEATTVVIQPGASVQRMATLLKDQQVIENPKLFRIAVGLMGLQGSLKAGEYTFPAAVSLRKVVHQLADGAVVQRSITIPEGLTVAEIMDRLQQLPLKVTEEDLDEIPEGTLYPDTYDYRYGSSMGALVERMQRRMEQELQAAWEDRTSDLPLESPNELLILASIVEKETAKPEERARIAGVFVNRLKKGMKLQSDPTVIYGASDYNGDLKASHLKEDQPYNTYLYTGLPPTPISNPGREALMATAIPESHDYLYFVADGVTGGHVFSRTYQEHLQNVEKYLRAYRQQHKGK